MLRGLFGFGPKIAVPSKEWVQERLVPLDSTPDLCELEEKPTHLLFVYDAKMSGFNPNAFGEGAERLWNGFTVDNFTLMNQRLGKASAPVALSGDKYKSIVQTPTYAGFKVHRGVVPAKPIKGEVWEIPHKMFISLDKEMDNTLYYERRYVKIAVPYRYLKQSKERGNYLTERVVEKVKAFMYVGIPDYWDNLVENVELFKPVSLYKANSPINGSDQFYFWTPREYEITKEISPTGE